MRLLRKFLGRVDSEIQINENDVLKINNKRFKVSQKLQEFLVRRDKLVFAGSFLGKDKHDFHPSSILLNLLASEDESKKIYVDRETAWLFVCGRDIFEENIVEINGEFILNNYFLVMFEYECLGYGKVTSFQNKKILKNIFDIGDFLRRER